MTGNTNHISDIITLFGGQSALARDLGLRQGTVWEWTAVGRVPAARIPEIIKLGRARTPPVVLEPNDFFTESERAGAA